jgi:hypothetical protein
MLESGKTSLAVRALESLQLFLGRFLAIIFFFPHVSIHVKTIQIIGHVSDAHLYPHRPTSGR